MASSPANAASSARLRPWQVADAPAWQDLSRALQLGTTSRQAADAWLLAWLDDQAAGKPVPQAVVSPTLPGLPVGVAGVAQTWGGQQESLQAELALAIHPRHRQQGMGGAALVAVLKQASQAGWATLWVALQDDAWTHWYTRRGFQPVPTAEMPSPLAQRTGLVAVLRRNV